MHLRKIQSTSPLSITIATLNNIKIRGTGKTPPNEETPTFATFQSGLRTNFAIPTDTRKIIFGQNSFDEDGTSFDSTNDTFDADLTYKYYIMAKQAIDIGTTANDGTGTTLRDGDRFNQR